MPQPRTQYQQPPFLTPSATQLIAQVLPYLRPEPAGAGSAHPPHCRVFLGAALPRLTYCHVLAFSATFRGIGLIPSTTNNLSWSPTIYVWIVPSLLGSDWPLACSFEPSDLGWLNDSVGKGIGVGVLLTIVN